MEMWSEDERMTHTAFSSILFLDVCIIISSNREDGISRFEEPFDDDFIDFYCELDAEMIELNYLDWRLDNEESGERK